MELKTIAHLRCDFPEKFGIPRQSGLVNSVTARIIFTPEYRNPDALRGLEQYSHLWLIWQFSEAVRDDWSPTVRPPRLGGNTRMGVFATRAPYRPNPIGLSCVKIEKIELSTKDGPVITVSGADIMDNTPIYDIKPYLAYVDSHPEASNGFALDERAGTLQVSIPQDIANALGRSEQAVKELLAQDPRPQYQNSPERIYTMSYGGFDISFTVDGKTLEVKSAKKLR
ncbi:MAG: tRNA (N6-threonylcarbamoyladenosine(37)-N6)-methyltransferase TrmO [Oscillospiraceae bacterium]|nr:tRNA (N6-threonylcarbamoyladenosine(37)-N6)-methyltransferase TrmO [Oscillospiraceae bacterium]